MVVIYIEVTYTKKAFSVSKQQMAMLYNTTLKIFSESDTELTNTFILTNQVAVIIHATYSVSTTAKISSRNLKNVLCFTVGFLSL